MTYGRRLYLGEKEGALEGQTQTAGVGHERLARAEQNKFPPATSFVEDENKRAEGKDRNERTRRVGLARTTEAPYSESFRGTKRERVRRHWYGGT